MPIVNSTYTVEHEQRDGSRWVMETHTDSAGEQHSWYYRALAGTDYAAVLAEHAAIIDQRLIDREIAEVLNA